MADLTLEQRVAKLAQVVEDALTADDGEINTMKAKVETVAKELGIIQELDLKGAVEEFDKMKSAQEMLTKQIKTSKKGMYVPGMEDIEGFSMLKAIMGVKTGDWSRAGKEKEVMDASREKAAQAIGDEASGGFFVADQVIPDVIGQIYTKSAWVALEGEGDTRISVLEGLTGGNVKIPKFDGGLIAYWIGEEDEYAESSTSVGDITMNPKKMGILVRLTDSMKRLQSYGFENLLRRDMVRAGAKKLDWTIPYGLGTDNMPKGIVRHNGVKIFSAETGETMTPAEAKLVSEWAGGRLEFEKLSQMQLALEEDDVDLDNGAAFISGPRYFNWLKNIRNTVVSTQTEEGKSFLLGSPMLTDEALRGVIGPFGKSTQTKLGVPGHDFTGLTTTETGANYQTVFGGNLSEIILGRWGGIEIESDNGLGKGFTSDHTYTKLRMYADIAVRQERGIIICPDAQVQG